MSMKGRGAESLANQMLWHAHDLGQPPMSRDEMASRAHERQRKRREAGWMRYRAGLPQVLALTLDQVGSEFEATVVRIERRKAYLEVPGFRNWGALPVDGHALEPQQKLTVKLIGFSTRDRRFHFELSAPPPRS